MTKSVPAVVGNIGKRGCVYSTYPTQASEGATEPTPSSFGHAYFRLHLMRNACTLLGVTSWRFEFSPRTSDKLGEIVVIEDISHNRIVGAPNSCFVDKLIEEHEIN
jgi:hypothetical protein